MLKVLGSNKHNRDRDRKSEDREIGNSRTACGVLFFGKMRPHTSYCNIETAVSVLRQGHWIHNLFFHIYNI
jgi:hypothetical protein